MDERKLQEIIQNALAGVRGVGSGLTGGLLKYPAAAGMLGASRLMGEKDTTFGGALESLEDQEQSDVKNFPIATRGGQGLGALVGAGKAVQGARALGKGAEAAREIASDIPTPSRPKDRLPGDAGDVYERSWRRSEKDKASEKQFAGEQARLDAKASAKPLRRDNAQQSSPEKIDRVLGAKDKAVSDMAAEAKAKQAAARESPEPEFMSNPNWTQKMQEVSDQVGRNADELGSNMRNYQRKKIDEELDGPTDKWWDEIDDMNPPSDNRPKADPNEWGNKLRESHSRTPAMDMPSGTPQERTIPGKSIYKEGANDMLIGTGLPDNVVPIKKRAIDDVAKADDEAAQRMGFADAAELQKFLDEFNGKP